MSTFQEPHHNQGFIPFAQPGYEAPTPHLATGTFQQMWQTRPARIPAKQGGHAKVAGVCEGIGVRYQIDPVLIRLFFVVTGVFGAGVAAYLIAWLCMPRYSVPVSPSKLSGPRATPKTATTAGGWSSRSLCSQVFYPPALEEYPAQQQPLLTFAF